MKAQKNTSDGYIEELKRQNDTLRAEADEVRGSNNELSQQLSLVRGSMQADRDARYAALNLMEDAMLARRAEQRENEQRRMVEHRLRELNRRKDEFLATLGHELRNPLAAIHASVQILRSPRTKEETRTSALDILDRQVDQMQRLVDDVVDVSRLVRGKVSLRPDRVVLQKVIRESAETIQATADGRRCHFEMDIPAETVELVADPVRLTQVFSNILTNAIRYSKSECRAVITLRVDADVAVVIIRDDGVGISPELLPHIFDLFVQANHSSDRSDAGLGLGLTVVRELVTMHGGRVEAYSEGKDCGSEFRIFLPLHRSDQ